MSDRPYSVRQLAERWGCSEKHIYNLINRGELPTFRAGGTLLRIAAGVVATWESGGSPTGSESTGSASSEIRPSPRGETPKGGTGSDSAKRAAKTRRVGSSIRSHIKRQGRLQPTAGQP